MPGPMDGIKVVEMGVWVAGPSCAAILCDWGADVIKIEPPAGDPFRGLFASALGAAIPVNPPFEIDNRGKRSVCLNFDHAEARAIGRRLLDEADVFVSNMRPRVLEQFGLDYDVVRGIRPDIVMLRMPAFGLTGPWRERPGFAQTMEQLTGMAWVTGYEGGPPIIPGGVVDPMVGTHAALALVAALEHRSRTGEGGLVEVPLVEVATAVTAEQVIRYSIDGTLLDRHGTPGVYRCKGDDAWVAVAVDRDPLPAAEREAWCATRTPEAAVEALAASGIPAAAMVPAFMTLDDPQLRAREFFEPVEHPHVGTHEYPTWPMRFSAGPERYWRGPAPTLGQHTDDVLRELGVTAAEIERLRADAVIGTTPTFGRR